MRNAAPLLAQTLLYTVLIPGCFRKAELPTNDAGQDSDARAKLFERLQNSFDPEHVVAELSESSDFGDGVAADTIREWTAFIKENPGDPEGYYERGRTYMDAGEEYHAYAAADFQRCVFLDPTNAEYQKLLSKTTDDAELQQRSFAEYLRLELKKNNALIEARPHYAMYYLERAEIYAHMGETKKAIADAEKCLELDPKIVSAVGLLYRLGKPEAAMEK